ncbi:hypothetical protein GNQ08_20445 [Paenibacillus macerans]|uniref:Uncharacterized protein n=1 Tax=Paenibacillus macerans TaxID=44252 RepID=A0A6N8F283_PAEMA|nr:hypothetical protein [Paenibacillus macerans]MUG24741.1 hypothetical protein [Paenibacillus macerans]
MSFEIANVKRVRKVYDDREVNDLIESGWILLHVGQESSEGNSDTVFALGHTDPPPPRSESKFQRFIKE